MRYRKRGKLQKSLIFEPQPRIILPEAARHEALGVLAALIAAVMGDPVRVRREGASDD